MAREARRQARHPGRRWGKTVLALIACILGHGLNRSLRGAIDGGNIAWVAPTFPLSQEVWRYLKKATEEAWTDKSEVERRIALPGGGAISVRSADEPDSLRGVGYDGCVLDEAAFAKKEAWTEALRPALADRQGWGVLISTPKGLNWFHGQFQLAETLPDWERWQQPTAANPLISAVEIEQARQQLDAQTFAQEFLSQFITPGGSRIQAAWFRYYAKRGDHYQCLAVDGSVASVVQAHQVRRVTMVDPAGSGKDVQRERRGKQPSYSVIATFDITRNGQLFWVDVERGRWEVPDLCHRIEAAYVRNHPEWVGIESQGLGLAVCQTVGRTRVPVRALKPGGKDKVERATKALVLMEQGKVFHPAPSLHCSWVKPLEDELLLWGGHDDDQADQIDCLAYAAIEATDPCAGGVIELAVHPIGEPIMGGSAFGGGGWAWSP